ncbi:MAG: DUF4838 domain-containing protein [Lentisphaeria bacterium]|nr:DUF4838 domain-containing protein [Lentisphaeria bacterium]
MTGKTVELARNELHKYGLEADFRLESDLPSFEIRREDGRTVIAAPDAVELLYGVYELAQYSGWFFFEPGRDRFDRTRCGALPPDGVVVPARKPLLKRRGFIQEFPFDAETADLFDWMAKNRLNYLQTWMKYYDALSDELKEAAAVRGIEIESGHHNFNYWIPGRKYNQTHPEFFAEIGGKRIESSDGKSTLLLSEQLCTTNPELRAEIVKNMLEYCEQHPEIKTVALNPNDGFGWCECSECSKFYDPSEKGDFYSLSEHVYKADRIFHDMLRDVGRRLHEKRPDLTLSFCAYINYCSPSPGFTLEKGMMVHFASYWRCINHTIDDPKCVINPHYADDIRRWAAVKHGGEINIYEYFMGVNFYLMLPMIHFREMFYEMRWYSENGVDGILTQFHIPHWSVYGMNYFLMARAARGEDEETTLALLFDRLFGADADEARTFYRAVKQLLLDTGHCHIPYPRSLLRRSRIEAYRELHRMALALADKAPEDRFRADLVLWTEYMIRFKELFDAYQAKRLTEADVHAFLEWIHTRGENRVLIPRKFDSYFRALLEDLRSGREWIHFNLDWEDDYIRRHDRILS